LGFGIVQQVAHQILPWFGVIATAADNQNSVLGRSCFKMAAPIRNAGRLAPGFRRGIEPVARTDIDLRLIVAMIAIDFPVERGCGRVSARIRQICFSFPSAKHQSSQSRKKMQG
jgi:hypothetical protein